MSKVDQIEKGPSFDALMLLSSVQEAQEAGDQKTLLSLTQDVFAWERAFFYADGDMVRLMAESTIASLCASPVQEYVHAGLSFSRRLIASSLEDTRFKRDLLMQYADDWIDGLSSPYEKYVALCAVVRPLLGQVSYKSCLSFVRQLLDDLQPAYKAGVERRAERPLQGRSFSKKKNASLRP